MNVVPVIVMLKDGGHDKMLITPEMLGDLSYNIVENGVETIHTATTSLEVVGVLVYGKQIGERVIMIPESRGEA